MRVITVTLAGLVLVLVSACASQAPSTISPSPIALAPILPPATPTPLPYPPPPPPVPALPPYPLPPSPTPGPTYTPEPTWTPRPTMTPTSLPTIIPPIQTATADQLPPITYDLLFIRKGSLMRWNHTSGQIETLAAPVAFFSVSDDGQTIALTRDKGGGFSEIAVLDMRQAKPRCSCRAWNF